MKYRQKKYDQLRLSEIDELKQGFDSMLSSGQAHTQIKKDKSDAEDIYRSLQSFMLEAKKKASKNQTIELESALIPIRKLIDADDLLESMYQFTIASGLGDYSILHPVNVMVYALKMGLQMRYSRTKLTELALSALVYDIGMFMIPDNVLLKKDALTESEIVLVKRHTEMAENALYTYKDDYPWLLRTVYEHHERENGQGYPRGIKGNEISEYAKIIGLCDSYEAMTHDRPHKKALTQFTSVRKLVEVKNLMFSHKILKAFLEEISLYPVGSYIKLNNKIIGRVIATNTDQLLKPVINVIFDGHGNRITEEITIDLKENTILVITGGVLKEEFPQPI